MAIIAFWAFAYYVRDLPLTPPNGVNFTGGDTEGYVEATRFIKTGVTTMSGWYPNHLLTNFAYLHYLIFFEKFGNIYLGWIILNSLFYILSGFILYKIIYRIFNSDGVALIGTTLFLGNYAAITFGLHYLTDMGSWMFYLAAAYFALEYAYTERYKFIYYASIMTGIGGLFKEYALGGYAITVGVITYMAYARGKKFMSPFVLATMISFVPFTLVQIYVYLQYHYSYLDWVRSPHSSSGYDSKIVEHIKVLIYLFNFAYTLFFYSAYLIYKNYKKYFDQRTLVYLCIVFISASPIFLWPGITERLDFVVVPFMILVSCVAVKEHEDRLTWFLPLGVIYLVTSFCMDAYILQPEWKQTLIGFIKNII